MRSIYLFALGLVGGFAVFSVGNAVMWQDGRSWRMCQPANIVNESLSRPLLEPSPPRLIDEPGPTPVRVQRVNRHGLRDSPFSSTPPNNTVRILVLGDSYVMGHGLNRSQRFTAIVEERLNTTFEKEIQLINAGLSGSGMRDYYQYLYNFGRHYRPEIVIVAFNTHDALSWSRRSRWKDRIRSQYGFDATESLQNRALTVYKKRMRRFFRNLQWRESEIRIYGNRLQELAEQEGMDLLFYSIDSFSIDNMVNARGFTVSADNGTVFDVWAGRCNMSMIYASPRLANDKRYTFPGRDSHYNVEGNKVLAEDLYPVLERLIEEGHN